jgi:hypothetical protein
MAFNKTSAPDKNLSDSKSQRTSKPGQIDKSSHPVNPDKNRSTQSGKNWQDTKQNGGSGFNKGNQESDKYVNK